MSKKSIKKNYIYNVCYQILLLITPLITTPYIARVLGADNIGNVSYAESIVSYFTLVGTLGITTYGQREISYVQDMIEKRSQVFWNTKILEFITAGIAFLAYIIFALTQTNSTLYCVLAFNILAVVMDVTWFFQGLEEFGKIVFRNIMLKILNIIYIFLFIKARDDIIKYAFGLAFFLFLGNASLWCYLPKYIKKITFSSLHPFSNIKTVLSLFIPTIAIQIYTVLDKTMIGLITQDSFENGYYEQAVRISKMIMTVVTALGTVMIPRIGYHFQHKEVKEVEQLMYRGYRFVWFLGIPLCFGLIIVSGNFVPWFFGSGYDKVVTLLKVLSFLILAIGINNVTGMQYLIPTKRQNMFTITVILGALTNFVMNAILINMYQSVGAAIASVTAETVIAVVQLVLVRKEISPLTVVKGSIHYVIAGSIMLTFLWALEKKLTPSVVHTGLLIIIGVIIYFSILIIIKDEFFVSNMISILNKIRKKKIN